GGFARTCEVARVDRLEVFSRELAGQPARLLSPVVGERPVGVTLQAAGGVPVGLAVSYEEELGQVVYASQPWISPALTAFASSPARPVGSVSRPRISSARKARRSSRPAAAAATSEPTSRWPVSLSASSPRRSRGTAASTCSWTTAATPRSRKPSMSPTRLGQR